MESFYLVPDMWGLISPNGHGIPKMWGVSVPPESQPMKMGGWKVGRNDITQITANQNG